MVKATVLGLALVGALGLAAEPGVALHAANGGSEALSALLTGTILLLVAAVAKRNTARRH